MLDAEVIIFDLDGTLLDTSPGVFGSVRYTEKKMNLKPVEDSELRRFVGPPPKEMYKTMYGLSNEEAQRAVGYHREYGVDRAIFEAKQYDGMQEVLEELKRRNYKLAVATLKKQVIAEKILEINSLSNYFDVIIGMDDKESFTKKMTIEKAMFFLGVNKAVMIGDSEYDYKGAIEANVDFLGVLYGFGFSKGSQSYPFETISSPKELLEIF